MNSNTYVINYIYYHDLINILSNYVDILSSAKRKRVCIMNHSEYNHSNLLCKLRNQEFLTHTYHDVKSEKYNLKTTYTHNITYTTNTGQYNEFKGDTAHEQRPGAPFTNKELTLAWFQHGQVITSPVQCGMKLLIHSQTSMAQPLKFGHG